MPPKDTTSPEVVTPTKKKTYTNWKAFEQMKLVPTSIKCEGYRPVFLADMSCHSHMQFKASTIASHIDGEHGGGFRFFLKTTDGKPHPIWQELEDAGLEAHDFRCEICDAQLRFAPSSIAAHLKPHSGKTRRVLPGGVLNLLIGKGKPEREEVDDIEVNS